MRTLTAFVVAFVALTGAAQAQDGYRVSAVSFGSGENPITSGIAATVQLTNDKSGFIEVTAQQEQAWFMMGKDYKLGKSVRASLYGSVGHQQSALWVGPYASITVPFATIGGKEVSIGVLTWPGFFPFREPRDWRTENDGTKNPEKIYAGYFSIATLAIGPVAITGTHLNFMDDRTDYQVGVEYTHKVRADVEAKGSVNYDRNQRRPMFFIGATWRPAKK